MNRINWRNGRRSMHVDGRDALMLACEGRLLYGLPLFPLSLLDQLSPDSRQSFRAWLDDFDALADDNAVDVMLGELTRCWDMLPPRYCEELGLPYGSTYRDAVNVIVSSWGLDAFSFPN